MAKPKKTYNVGSVSLAVWENTGTYKGKETVTQSITVNKSYKDQKTGEWKQSGSFKFQELALLRIAIDEALKDKYIRESKEEF